MGKIKWSPKLQHARDLIRYYKLCISKKLKRKVGSRILLCLAKKLKVDASKLSIKELESNLDKSYKNYILLKKDAEKEREAFMDDLAESLAKKNKQKQSKVVKQLMEREQNRDMYHKLKVINHKIAEPQKIFILGEFYSILHLYL